MLNLSFFIIFSFIVTLNTLVFVHSSFSKPPPCDSSTGCSCRPGFWGKHCQFCRLRLTSDTGTISDGPQSYKEASKCAWLIETSRANSTIELDLEQFATECSWDHLYVYGGNSIHAPLLGTLSGLIRDQSIHEVAKEPIRHLRIHSNTAFLYFYSDANYVLTGFNIKYRVTKDCSSKCSNHGYCGSHGNCICDPGWTGSSCKIASCLMNCLSGTCNNVTRQCEGCNYGFTGPSCNITSSSGYWTHVPATNQKVMTGRASHTSSVIGDWIWVYGGYAMDNTPFNDLIRYHISQNTWEVVTPDVSRVHVLPRQRYGHSMIEVNETIVVFGGIVDKKTVGELWRFNTRTRQWRQVWVPVQSDDPVAVAGHTATLVGNKMVVIFGYGPKEGYTQRVQVLDLETMSWQLYNISSLVVRATFGHSSAYDSVSGMIYIHGGYRATISNNAEISSDLYAYMPSKNKWLILVSSGYPRFLHSSVLLGNLLLVFGGNTHNDTSEAQKKTRCYSPDLMMYDMRCNTWTKVPMMKSLSSQAARFGHSAVKNNGTMYVIGGFQGTMLSDILRYTTGDCSSHVNKSSCLDAYPMYGCVRSISDDKCIGPLNADLIKSNNIEKPTCPANPKPCSSYNNCNQCTSSIFQCAWCGKACIKSTFKCLRKKVTEENQCPRSSLTMPGLCSGSDKSSSLCAHTVCNDYSTCKSCTGNDKCMWCESQRKCVGLNAYVVSFPYGQCHAWTKDKCADVICEGRKTCQDCHTLPGCGWCDDGSGTGLGRCIPGGDGGPFSGRNSSVVSNKCLPILNKKMWFFIECPVCQCNGHSTCDDEGKCKQCHDNTNGSHCQTCATGYFGDPANGGRCQACKCNGHSNECHPKTGVCNCRTKGVKGDNCELCYRHKGFYGNATNKGFCYYNLTSGFLFTFPLNGTTGVSFLNVPKKDDRDVDFTISITGNDALVNITYKTKSTPEQPFVLAKRVGKYEYSFKHDEFDFGDSSKFTFFVYVYGITGNCVVEISFSQLMPFMLLRFFLTFFGCFFSILIVTFIAWKIKIKYNNYIMRRQRIVELHQMANRPSSTLKILHEKDGDFDNSSALHQIPIAMQPFASEAIAIATVMIRLPSLPDGITPIDQSGLCLGSVLIDRSHCHMPSLRHVRYAQKKASKRKDDGTTRCI